MKKFHMRQRIRVLAPRTSVIEPLKGMAGTVVDVESSFTMAIVEMDEPVPVPRLRGWHSDRGACLFADECEALHPAEYEPGVPSPARLSGRAQ